MAEVVDTYKLVIDDSDLQKLEGFERALTDVGQSAEKTGKQLEDALTVDGAAGKAVVNTLNDIQREYAELEKASGTLRNAIRNATNPEAVKIYRTALADVNAGMRTLEKAADGAGVSLKNLNKEGGLGKQVFNEFFGAFTKAALIATAIQKVVEFTKYAVGLAQETKRATLQFQAFLGSAEKAGEVVSELQAFSSAKFIDTGAVFEAGKALLAFGEDTDNLTKVLGRVADISAATGKNFNELVTIYGKARAAGVLYAEDINQLVDAGIPIIGEFAKQLGVSTDQVKKLASEGKISFEELQLAFFNLTKEGALFAGQAAVNAETISGAWQGLVNDLRPAISAVGGFFSEVGKGIIQETRNIIASIGGVLDFTKNLFGVAVDGEKQVFDLVLPERKKGLSELEKLEQEAAKRRAELSKQNNKQAEEAAKKRRQQRIDEFNQTLKDVDEQAKAIDRQLTFNPVERVQKEYADAIEAATELEKKLVGLAETPQQKAIVKASMSKLFDELLLSYNEELSKAEIELEKLRKGKAPFDPLPQANTVDDDLKFRVQGVVKSLQAAAQEAISGQEPRTLAEILGISEQGLEGLKDASAQIIESLNQIADARVKEADAAVDAAQRKVDAAQDALIREQELAAEGLANNTALREQELEQAKKLREEAEKERAKAVRSQILLDSVSQISSLVSASANIFKSLSTIPFAGIPLAIATIGIMFGAFAKAKADALKAASVPKFRKGGKLEGPAHEYGGIAISDNEGNVYGEAEGGEWIVNRKGSLEHDRFLKRLNDGEFSGIDLDRVFRPSASNPVVEAAPHIQRIEREFREIRETQHTKALEQAYYAAAAQIVQAIEEKEVVTPLTNYRVTKKRGRNSYTKVVREEK